MQVSFLLPLIVLEIGHPSVAMQRANFANFNGEDIELASRELSQSQVSVRGRADVILINCQLLY
jgi:hypothetical protein